MKIAWLAPDGKHVKAGDVVVRFDPTRAREAAARRPGRSRSRPTRKLAREQIKSQVGGRGARRRRDARAPTSSTQQRKFQSKDEEIFSRNQIIESEIDEKLAAAKQEHAEQTKEVERKLAQSKAGVIAVEQQKAQVAIAHAKTALESMEIRAPHDGIFVLRSQLARRAAEARRRSCGPARRSPRSRCSTTMEAEVFVLEVDGSGLDEGQPAEVVDRGAPRHHVHTARSGSSTSSPSRASPGAGPVLRRRGRARQDRRAT